MGYYVKIVSCVIKPTEPIKHEEINSEYWQLSDDKIEPVKCEFKLDDDFEESLKQLAEIGCCGSVEIVGEDGEHRMYVLYPEYAEVDAFEGRIIYPETPDYVL
jgi:hypothetical protein